MDVVASVFIEDEIHLPKKQSSLQPEYNCHGEQLRKPEFAKSQNMKCF